MGGVSAMRHIRVMIVTETTELANVPPTQQKWWVHGVVTHAVHEVDPATGDGQHSIATSWARSMTTVIGGKLRRVRLRD